MTSAEEYHGTTPGGVTILVARRGGPTYAKEEGTSYLRRLKRSDAQSLSDLGSRFPDTGKMSVNAPRRAGGYWLLPIVQGGDHGTMRISAKSLLLKSFAAKVSGRTVTEHDTALTQLPALPTPQPRC